MERVFRRLHWRWLALCAVTATMAGCAPVPVADSDAQSGALMVDAGANTAAQAPSSAGSSAIPSAGRRASRAPRAVQPLARASEAGPAGPAASEAHAESDPNPEFALVPSRDSDQQGLASWYGPGLHGRLTASGERFDKEEFTAAHRSFAFGSRVCVRSAATGKTVVVRINDRGPFAPGRVIDLSQAAAQELGMVGLGIKPVELWQLDDGEQECPETLMTAKKAESLKKTQQARAQVPVRSQVQAKAPGRNTRVQARAPAPKARTAVASRAPASPAAAPAPAASPAAATAVASAAQGAR